MHNRANVETCRIRRNLPRIVDAVLERALGSFPAVLIDGARATGKTTTALQIANSTVKLPQDLAVLQLQGESYLRSLQPPVLIDDWQLGGNELLWLVKDIVDADPTPGRFILTGSVEPASYGPTYPLTGLALRLQMRPMTQRGLAGKGGGSVLEQLAQGEMPAVTAGRKSEFMLENLFRTGFPAARNISDPAMFLDGYAATASLWAGDKGRDATRLLRVLRVLATLDGQAVPDQRIWEAADVNKATWKTHQDLLERAGVAASLPAFSSNQLNRITQYPKRFLVDTALALRLARIETSQLLADGNLLGRYFESYVICQLRPTVDALGGEIFHVRTAGGAQEADAVIELPHGLIAVEAKAAATVSRADIRSLSWLQSQMDGRFLAGIVAYADSDIVPLEDRLMAIPVELL